MDYPTSKYMVSILIVLFHFVFKQQKSLGALLRWAVKMLHLCLQPSKKKKKKLKCVHIKCGMTSFATFFSAPKMQPA